MLVVQKTRRIETVVTMAIGAFSAVEIIGHCRHDKQVFKSRQLGLIKAEGCKYGFDVIESVGKALFVECKNEQLIVKELAKRNVHIPRRTIGYLGRKFIVYLALAHRQSRQQLKSLMLKKGGYILHIDGTCEGESPHLFCGIDGISELVLNSIKIPSEKKELLVPFFRHIKQDYGNPVALVHDMGIGIMKAVETIFQGLPDFICHFHFLRDIGKDLLLNDYQKITGYLRKHNVRALLRKKAKYLEKKIEKNSSAVADLKKAMETGETMPQSFSISPAVATYTLIHWILSSSCDSHGYGFPFDRPHLELYSKIKKGYCNLVDISKTYSETEPSGSRPFIQVLRLLEKIMQDEKLSAAVKTLEAKAKVFDKLRQALRIALPDGKDGLNDNGDETDIKTIEASVNSFKVWLLADSGRRKIYEKMIEQIDKYWEKLFADPIEVQTSAGKIKLQPQRTNNIMERFFRDEKRKCRRKTGNSVLGRVLKAILADTPLVRNLENEEYRKIILKGCSSLAERFAQIDAKLVQQELFRAQMNQEKLLHGVKNLIKFPDLPEKISSIFLTKAI